jgi:hypothetical protein
MKIVVIFVLKVIRINGFVKSPSSRRASRVESGVLSVRRSDNAMKRNAEIGLFTKPSNRDLANNGNTDRLRARFDDEL